MKLPAERPRARTCHPHPPRPWPSGPCAWQGEGAGVRPPFLPIFPAPQGPSPRREETPASCREQTATASHRRPHQSTTTRAKSSSVPSSGGEYLGIPAFPRNPEALTDEVWGFSVLRDSPRESQGYRGTAVPAGGGVELGRPRPSSLAGRTPQGACCARSLDGVCGSLAALNGFCFEVL